ncbi:MAG TPA: helix-turn-helix transcriptional regulator [Candidatus Elarobacter sp.]|jgi:ribosome-binding protein aMBF1 (putative translation factor)|nr:helix-turn-helix transcriptional regulator [Candidatus Elarobacter sp.]
MKTRAALSPLGSDHAAVAAARAENPSYRAASLRLVVAEKVARLLIGYRQQQRLTQAELAAALGMKESAVSRLESGDHVPNIATLGRIAEVCNVDVVLNFAKRVPQPKSRRNPIPA